MQKKQQFFDFENSEDWEEKAKEYIWTEFDQKLSFLIGDMIAKNDLTLPIEELFKYLDHLKKRMTGHTCFDQLWWK